MTVEEVKEKVWAGDVWGALWANAGQSEVSTLDLALNVGSYSYFLLGLQRITCRCSHSRDVQSRRRLRLHRDPKPLFHRISVLPLPSLPRDDRHRFWDCRHRSSRSDSRQAKFVSGATKSAGLSGSVYVLQSCTLHLYGPSLGMYVEVGPGLWN